MRRICYGVLASVLIQACEITAAPAADAPAPAVHTNEMYLADVTRNFELVLTDEKAVFAFVFGGLPDRVKVYPTENYFYFKFSSNGSQYSGNFRFENETRDQGKLHFAYGIDDTQWSPPAEAFHILLDHDDGIDLDRIDALTYRVTHNGKRVVFELNDLSDVKLSAKSLAPDERVIGPIFDESGVQFFLVYNSKLKQFLYLLNESAPPSDVLHLSQVSSRILIGQRTGFAYYRDHRLDRKILIGAFRGNVQANNYFDGPFDQLPDNFIEGENLRSAILDIEPELKGLIDRYGSNSDGSVRYAIVPYLDYEVTSQLAIFHRCAIRILRSARYYACFVIDRESRKLRVTADRKPPIRVARPMGRKKRD